MEYLSKTILAVSLALLFTACSGSWAGRERKIIENGCDTLHVYTVNVAEENRVLRTKCTDFSTAMLKSCTYEILASKMKATVTAPSQDGVGIAGPQVGISRNIVAVQRFDKDGWPFEVYPNIRIDEFRGGMEEGPEGCLSVPDQRGNVLRYRDITIVYTDINSDRMDQPREIREDVKGFAAVIFQHECDHLDGVLYIDKIEPAEQ